MERLTNGLFSRRGQQSTFTEDINTSGTSSRSTSNDHPYAATLATIFNRLKHSASGQARTNIGLNIEFIPTHVTRFTHDLYTAAYLNDELELNSIIKLTTEAAKNGGVGSVQSIDAVIQILKIEMGKLLQASAYSRKIHMLTYLHDWIVQFEEFKQLDSGSRVRCILAVTQPSYIRYLLTRSLGWDKKRVSFGVTLSRKSNSPLDQMIKKRLAQRSISFRSELFDVKDVSVSREYKTKRFDSFDEPLATEGDPFAYQLLPNNELDKAVLAHATLDYSPVGADASMGSKVAVVTADQLCERGVMIVDLDTKAKVNRLLTQSMLAYGVLINNELNTKRLSPAISDDAKYAAPTLVQNLTEGGKPFTLKCDKPKRQASTPTSEPTKKRPSANPQPSPPVPAKIKEKQAASDLENESEPDDPMIVVDPEMTQTLDDHSLPKKLRQGARNKVDEASEEEDAPEVKQYQSIPQSVVVDSPSLKRKRSEEDDDDDADDGDLKLSKSSNPANADGAQEKRTPKGYRISMKLSKFNRFFKKPRLGERVVESSIQATVKKIRSELDEKDEKDYDPNDYDFDD